MVYGEGSRAVLEWHLTRIAAVFAAARPNNDEAARNDEAQSRFISVIVRVGLAGFEPATHGLGTRCLLFRGVCECSQMWRISGFRDVQVRLRSLRIARVVARIVVT